MGDGTKVLTACYVFVQSQISCMHTGTDQPVLNLTMMIVSTIATRTTTATTTTLATDNTTATLVLGSSEHD